MARRASDVGYHVTSPGGCSAPAVARARMQQTERTVARAMVLVLEITVKRLQKGRGSKEQRFEICFYNLHRR